VCDIDGAARAAAAAHVRGCRLLHRPRRPEHRRRRAVRGRSH
jgi:hypothetical protein